MDIPNIELVKIELDSEESTKRHSIAIGSKLSTHWLTELEERRVEKLVDELTKIYGQAGHRQYQKFMGNQFGVKN